MTAPVVTAERLRSLLHYDPDTGVFTRRAPRGKQRAGDVAGTVGSHGYVQIMVDYRKYRAHRLAYLYMTGEWPAKHVDHKDRNTANNAWRNLREASNAENARNKGARPDTTSGFKGVSWSAALGKWRVGAKLNGRQHHGGYHITPEAAYAAACSLRERLHGEFCNHGTYAEGRQYQQLRKEARRAPEQR